MFRTIFGKQLALYLSVLIISFSILGAVLSQVLGRYLTNQRVEFLKDTGKKAQDCFQGFDEAVHRAAYDKTCGDADYRTCKAGEECTPEEDSAREGGFGSGSF